jgi:creatinine amidohydrolase
MSGRPTFPTLPRVLGPLGLLPALLGTVALLAAEASAQAATFDPALAPPGTVFLEDLTWDEIRDLREDGFTSVIVATAGTEQNGPHMVMGKHRYILEYTTQEIARALGNTLVAPIITYVPEGNWDPPSGHMRMPGTITLPPERFTTLLLHTGRSLAAGGFTEILFLEDSGGNVAPTREAVARLNEEWAGSGVRAHHITDYYAKSIADSRDYIVEELGIAEEEIGGHAGISDTSQLWFINRAHIRTHELAPGGGFEGSGVSGNPTLASPEIGYRLLRIRVDNALAQIRAAVPPTAGPRGGGVPRLPRTHAIEEMTWTEIRDALAAGKTTVIVPTGGTEQNGPHMIAGKHNYIITHAATLMAERLGNALVAPTLQYVPQGDYSRPGFGDKPGVLSYPGPDYEELLDAAARSLHAHGFTDILFIGDSGGNQAGLTAVAERLNEEWEGSPTRVYALVDYYRQGAQDFRAWLLAQHGYDDATVGRHAGISDTSQLLYVHPQGIRLHKRAPGGGHPDAGVTGDPTRATPEIGAMGIEFKVNAALAQYRSLKAASAGG